MSFSLCLKAHGGPVDELVPKHLCFGDGDLNKESYVQLTFWNRFEFYMAAKYLSDAYFAYTCPACPDDGRPCKACTNGDAVFRCDWNKLREIIQTFEPESQAYQREVIDYLERNPNAWIEED